MTDITLSNALPAEGEGPNEGRQKATLPLCRPWVEIGWAVIPLPLTFVFMVISLIVFRNEVSAIGAAGGAAPSANGIYLVGANLIVLQIIMIGVAVARGRYLGGGDLALGLGAGPIRRPWAVALASLVQLVLSGLVASLYWASRGNERQLIAGVIGDPVLLIGSIVAIIVLAPISEELFFRGWLWTALRRSWGVWPTALCTAGAWLALHGFNGGIQVKLLPIAMVLCIVRHWSGTVRATIVIHAVNNAVAMILSLVWFLSL